MALVVRPVEKMRVCPRCAVAKPPADFYDRPRPGYCRQCSRAYVLEWRKRFPHRRYAHQQVMNAVKYGELVRPNVCERCKETTYTVAHHEDYDKPLDVNWLCDVCHAKRHVEMGRTQPRTQRSSAANGKKGGRPPGKRKAKKKGTR